MRDVAPFRRAVEALQPGAGGRAAAALLDNKISRAVAQHWLAGRRQAPLWALHMLADKLEQRAAEPLAIAQELKTMPERIGKRAGAKNLARYLANRHQSRND